MKIEWTKRISEDIVEIMKVRPIAAMVNYIVSNNIKDKMDVSEKLEELRKHATAMHEDLKEYSVDQIIMTLIIEALISQQFAVSNSIRQGEGFGVRIATPVFHQLAMTSKN